MELGIMMRLWGDLHPLIRGQKDIIYLVHMLIVETMW